MTFVDWARESRREVSKNGVGGVTTAAREFYAGIPRRIRRVLRRFHRLYPDERELTVDGYSIRVRQETIGEFDHIHQAFRNEHPMYRDLLAELGPDDVFWDVGGNVGYYTCFARQTGAETVVFEPLPRNVETIRYNLENNGIEGVTIDSRALFSERTTKTLFLDPRECAGGGRGSLLEDWTEGTSELEVDCVVGDDLVADGERPAPTVLKVDVEGAEHDVLRGLNRALQESIRVVYLEPHGIDDDAVYDFLEDHGFTIRIEPDDTTAGVLKAVR